ncbi:MAG: hypothetical protein M3O70_18175 [Actinomycetota bacterium]|nr:hypothetical protein [Actinomycetota bacterium]
MFELGVDTAWAFDRPDGRRSVEFLRRSGGESNRTEHLVTAEVDRAAAKERVLSRPAAVERDTRHLFAWLDPDFCGDVEFGLWTGRPEAAPPPKLPPSIDHVWVAMWSLTPGEGIGHVVVWEEARGTGWRYPPAVLDQDE